MANLRKINRPMRKLPDAHSLDAITRAAAAGGAIKYDPQAMGVEAPRIDVRGFLDEVRGAAAIGQGIQDVGRATMAAAVVQGEAVAFKQELAADKELGEIETGIAAAIGGEPDEMKWGTILDEHLEKARTQVLSKPRLAIAQDKVMAAHSQWEGRQRHQVSVMQMKKSVDGTRESIFAKATRLRANKDFPGILQMAEDPEVQKWIGEDAAAQMSYQAQKEQEAEMIRARREIVEQNAAAAPALWLERNQEPGDMDPDDWQAGQAMARQVQSAQVDSAATELADAMAQGDVKTDADIKRIAANRLRPAALAEVKSNLKNMQSDAWRSENLSQDGVMKNFGLLLSEAEKYDKAQDPDGSKYAGLVFRIKTLMPEELRGEITQPLARKWNPGNGPDVPEPIKGLVRETLRNWFEDGKFGVTKKQVPLAPEDPGYYPNTKKMKWVDDPPARDAAATRRAQTEMEMSKWLKENPNASAKEAKEQLLRSSTAALLPGDVSALLRKPPPAPPAVDPATRLKEIGMRFGGMRVPPTGELGAPHLTVFGGPNDPDDNGLSAFGGATGPSGREGVAVPEKILRHFYGGDKDTWEQVQVEATMPDGTKQVLPIADLGTAEWVWKKNGQPVMDLTEGAVEQLGGDVIYGKNGTLKGVKGLDGVKFRLLPLNTQNPPFSE